MIRTALVFILLLTFAPNALAQPKKQRPPRPKPTVANLAYANDSPRQVLDFWQAKSDKPTPVVVFIHGGGWRGGDKSKYRRPDIQPLLSAGISVASINYRYIEQAMEQNVSPPVSACVHDAARAIQTIRSKASEWNIDPKRIAATGGSAGACTSLWLAMHDDLAKPDSDDPIERESSRLACAAVIAAQTSLDPLQVREWISNAEYGGHALGFAKEGRRRPEEFALLVEHREEVLPWIKEYSPIELVTSDDPPIYLHYPNQKTAPTLGQKEPDPTHSAMYGVKLAEKLREANVEVVLAYPGQPDKSYGSPTKFLIEKLSNDSADKTSAQEAAPFHIQAHRGAGIARSENTLESFQWAWEHGVTPEADLRTTKDDVIVCFHDPTLERVVSNVDEPQKSTGVEQLTLAEIQKFDVGSFRGERYVGQHIPTLASVLSKMSGYPDRQLYLDVKTVDLDQLVALVREHDVEPQVIFTTTKYELIRDWRRRAPESMTLCWNGGTHDELSKKLAQLRQANFEGITYLQIHVRAGNLFGDEPFDPSSRFLAEIGQELKSHGIVFQVLPWECSDQRAYEKLLELGVESFATDYPEVTLAAVRSYRARQAAQ